MQEVNWEKRDKLEFGKNVVEPILVALKTAVETEKAELERKLLNLKRLGVISMNKEQLNKVLEDMKMGTKNK
jgi:hypothetical protein